MEHLILLLPKCVPTSLFLIIGNRLSEFSNWNMEVFFDSSLYLTLQNPNLKAVVVESTSSIITVCIHLCPSFCHPHPRQHDLSVNYGTASDLIFPTFTISLFQALQWIDITLRIEFQLVTMDHMALHSIVPSPMASVPQKGWSFPHPRKLILLTHSLFHQGFLWLALSYPSDFSVSVIAWAKSSSATLFKETHT